MRVSRSFAIIFLSVILALAQFYSCPAFASGEGTFFDSSAGAVLTAKTSEQPAAPDSRPAAVAADRLKKMVIDSVAAQSGVISGEVKKLSALLAAGMPAIAGNDPAAETLYSRSFFKEMTRLYATVMPAVMDAVPVSLEVGAAEEFYADGFFMDTDNPPELVKKYNAALARLVGTGTMPGLKYRVCALSDDGLMAFAKGGQVIVLTAGFAALPAGELTAAIAHEMAHLERRHFLMYRVIDAVNKILLPGLGGDAKLTARALEFAKLRFQRQLEYEADSLALKLLRATGFQPDNLERLLARLIGNAGAQPPRLGDDHPTMEARLKAISRHLKK